MELVDLVHAARTKSPVVHIPTGRVVKIETLYGKGNGRQPGATTTRVMFRYTTMGNIESCTAEEIGPHQKT